MSNAYRGPEETERVAQLREELAKRKEHFDALSKVVEDEELTGNVAVISWMMIPWLFLLGTAIICFAYGMTIEALIALAAVIFVGLYSRIFLTIAKRWSARLDEVSQVSEFEEPRAAEPAKKQRVQVDDEELARKKVELQKRREAYEEIEREIADAESLLALGAKKENRR